MNAEPVLRVEQLKKQFVMRSRKLGGAKRAFYAVDGVDLEVFPGETVGLVGESGSGKSTLGRLAIRLADPTSGRVILGSQDITTLGQSALRPVRRKMQMVFQDPYSSFDPHATVASSLAEPLRTHFSMNPRERDQRVHELLDLTRLSRSYAGRYPHELSGGQLQRLAVARAIALDPKIIVADEPVSSLDVSTQAQVLEVMANLQRDRDVAYLFISHDLSVVKHVSNRIAVMYLGQLMEVGKAAEVLSAPKHPYARALLSAIPIPDPTKRHRERVLLRDELRDVTARPEGCVFRLRCPDVMPICSTAPPNVAVAPSWTVRCHLYGETKVEAETAVNVPKRSNETSSSPTG